MRLSTDDRRLATLVVWLVWAALAAALVACVPAYTYNIPLAEDWHLVPPLTGHEPDLWSWLWAQNNEHRLPLPRLVLLSVLMATGDFRAGMLVSVALIAVAALVVLRALASIRGGRLRYSDAFVPIALLHIGNWENFMWSWQLCFVLSSALALVLLWLIADRQFWTAPGRAAAAGLVMAALPLCGANGLAFAAPFAAWLTFDALRWQRADPARRAAVRWVLCGVAVGVAAGCYYFVGYTRATWNPPSPGLTATMKTAWKFLTLGFGPAVTQAMIGGAIALALVLVPAVFVTARAGLLLRADDRGRALRLLAYVAGAGSLALAFGWGRAGLVPTVGLPDRYVLLAVPALIWAYVAVELYAATALRRAVQIFLFVLACVLLPFNVQDGFAWRDWYRDGMASVVTDLTAGHPPPALVERHGRFLMHWSPDRLAAGMLMLRDARIGPFAGLAEPPPAAGGDQ